MSKPLYKLSALLLSLLVFLFAPGARAVALDYTVVVDGITVTEAQAEMRDGQLMVAVRPYVEVMGGGVSWSPSDRRATVSYDGSEVAFWVGSTLAYHNGVRLTSPVAPYVKSGRMMVPAWWLAVRLGANVRYSQGTLTVETGDYLPGPSPGPGLGTGNALLNPAYVFPFPSGVAYEPYTDTWGDGRSYEGRSFPHEGIDILAKKGTPIVSVAAGTVVRFGWNTLGGYRVTVQLDDYPQYRFYYAHMDRYAPNLYQGAHVKAGQLLGYVGNTGEGPERTEGRFVTHLHFGVYAPEGAINPYRFLKYWERNKVAR